MLNCRLAFLPTRLCCCCSLFRVPVAKQAKKLGQKLKLQQGEDDEEDEEDEEEPAGRGRRKGKGEDEEDAALWGANKKAYYGADEEVGG